MSSQATAKKSDKVQVNKRKFLKGQRGTRRFIVRGTDSIKTMKLRKKISRKERESRLHNDSIHFLKLLAIYRCISNFMYFIAHLTLIKLSECLQDLISRGFGRYEAQSLQKSVCWSSQASFMRKLCQSRRRFRERTSI